ncbi:MAG: hypothetical protein AAF226_18550, partial [Verrucomicrobiota bacterium]
MKVRSLSVGPILGWTRDDKIRVWGRGRAHQVDLDEVLATFGIAEVRQGDETISRCFKMKHEFNGTGAIDISGLQPNESFEYRVGYVVADL